MIDTDAGGCILFLGLIMVELVLNIKSKKEMEEQKQQAY